MLPRVPLDFAVSCSRFLLVRARHSKRVLSVAPRYTGRVDTRSGGGGASRMSEVDEMALDADAILAGGVSTFDNAKDFRPGP